MPLQYGFNITASDVKKLLEKRDKQASGIRTWQQRFGGASLGYNTNASALTSNYADVVKDAYAANLAQTNNIMNAGLSSGATREMMSASKADLRSAYETYIRNYQQDMTALTEDYSTELTQIDEALTKRAENFASLYNNAYKYLSEELYGAYNPTTQNDFLAEHNLDWLLTDPVDNYRNVIPAETLSVLDAQMQGLAWTDEAKRARYADIMTQLGYDTTRQVRSWNNLSAELFNTDGTLNEKGVKFYDAMFNLLPEDYVNSEGNALRSFDKWLDETDPDLRNWWINQDDYNYTFAGNNIGTSKSILGIDSTDQIYAPYEYEDFSKFAGQIGATELAAARESSQKQKENDALLAEKGYERGFMNFIHTRFGDMKERRNALNAKDELNTKVPADWRAFQQSFANADTSLQNTFKAQIGSTAYEEFKKNNKALFDKYEELSKLTEYSDENAKEYQKYYNQMLSLIKSYLQNNTIKNTGF